MNYKIRPDPTIALILLLITIVHMPLLFNDFHTDDFQILILMEDGFGWRDLLSMENLSNFRPFTNIVIFLRSFLFDNISCLWYMLNILLHLIIVSLLYIFVKSEINKTAAIAVVLFFGIYFQHFEAVLWLYGIVRLLAATMIILAAIFLFKYLRDYQKSDLLKSFIFFFLALFTVKDSLIFSIFFAGCLFIGSKKS